MRANNNKTFPNKKEEPARLKGAKEIKSINEIFTTSKNLYPPI
jgi:hypothetical protein